MFKGTNEKPKFSKDELDTLAKMASITPYYATCKRFVNEYLTGKIFRPSEWQLVWLRRIKADIQDHMEE